MAYPNQWSTAQYHELAFWRHVRVNGYDGLPWPKLFQKHGEDTLSLLSKLKPITQFSADTVVDFGCGPIGVPCYLQCKHVIGIDPLMGAYGHEFEHLRTRADAVHWIASRGEEAPLRNASADVVFSRNVLDHVESPPAWVAEFVRVLRPGGLFLLYVNLAEDWNKEGTDVELHPYSFTEAEVIDLLNGFPLEFSYYVDRQARARDARLEVPIIITGKRTE
ncbi:MAG: class I SAM-dependent methyltransferase [Chloroflexi bacterium]|nr:class I SAM-dependent methyltransferase [Chloroflexota bacterium]